MPDMTEELHTSLLYFYDDWSTAALATFYACSFFKTELIREFPSVDIPVWLIPLVMFSVQSVELLLGGAFQPHVRQANVWLNSNQWHVGRSDTS